MAISRSCSGAISCISWMVGLWEEAQMVQGSLLSFSLRMFSLWESFLVNFIIAGKGIDDFFVD